MNEFERNGYLIIKNLIPVKKWHDIAKSLESKCIADEQTPNSPALWNNNKLKPLHKLLLPKLEKIVNLELFKTYFYFRI